MKTALSDDHEKVFKPQDSGFEIELIFEISFTLPQCFTIIIKKGCFDFVQFISQG